MLAVALVTEAAQALVTGLAQAAVTELLGMINL